MSEANDDFDLIEVRLTKLKSCVVTLKVPKGFTGNPPDFQKWVEMLRDGKRLGRLGLNGCFGETRWSSGEVYIENAWIPRRKTLCNVVLDARPLIQKEVAPPPKYDPDELKEFIEEGTKAWADVPDAAAWVRELRGGKP
jgi:hypothetical protein